jgi:cysteine desulfurase
LETKGYEVTYLDVDHTGLISLTDLENSIKQTTALIAVMYVNNEIGIIQDIPKIGDIARKKEVAFFCDATQAIGKIPVDVMADKIDMLCLSAHKLNGPKGVGALFIKRGIAINPILHGGGQENGLRAGTYNTPLIVGLGETAKIAKEEFNERVEKLYQKQIEIEEYVVSHNIGKINFKDQKRAPHIVSVALINEDAEDFLIKMNQKFVASTGSACNSRISDKSHVQAAIGLNSNNMRLSYG